jgi:DNA-directed RNA polymerase subunit N (RpoN/RPB10)
MKLDRDGYAIIPSKSASVRAHRARWVEVGNEKANVLDHLCRNRWCCNPAHLESVTPAENVRRGDCTKLTEETVAQIRSLYAEGTHTQVAIGQKFGVSQGHVSHLVRGMYWSAGACKHWEQRKEARRV